MNTITLILTDEELENLKQAVDEDDRGEANLLGGCVREWSSEDRQVVRGKLLLAIIQKSS